MLALPYLVKLSVNIDLSNRLLIWSMKGFLYFLSVLCTHVFGGTCTVDSG